MKCAQFQRAWMEQWDGEPGRPASGVSPALAEHLAACAACERETRALASLRETLRADPEPVAPPYLAALALAQCVTAPAPRSPQRWRWGWVPALTLGGAVLACSLVAVRMPWQRSVVKTPLSPGMVTKAPAQMNAREARALAALGRAAHRAERARMRAAAALGRAVRLGIQEEL